MGIFWDWFVHSIYSIQFIFNFYVFPKKSKDYVYIAIIIFYIWIRRKLFVFMAYGIYLLVFGMYCAKKEK